MFMIKFSFASSSSCWCIVNLVLIHFIDQPFSSFHKLYILYKVLVNTYRNSLTVSYFQPIMYIQDFKNLLWLFAAD